MSGRPKCPNCGYEDPAFGSTNDRIACGNCNVMYDPEEAHASGLSISPVPTFRRIGVILTGAGRKPKLTKDGNRPKSSGRRSDRGDNRDSKQPYDPFGGNDA